MPTSKQERCGDDDDQHCHHGICVDLFTVGSNFVGSVQTAGERYMCDCSAANEIATGVAFAGKYCEVQSTLICSDKKDDFNGKNSVPTMEPVSVIEMDYFDVPVLIDTQGITVNSVLARNRQLPYKNNAPKLSVKMEEYVNLE